MSRKPFLPGWLAAILGGLTYLLLHLAIELAFPDHWAGSPDRLLGMSYAAWSRFIWIPLLLLLLSLRAVYRHLARHLGKLGLWGYRLAALGFILDILGNVIEFWLFGVFLVPFAGEFTTGSAGSNFGYEISSFGSLAMIVGLLLFGIACLRSPSPAQWRVLPFITGLVYLSGLYFFFANLMAIHAVLFGTCWVAYGYLLRKET